MKTFQLVLHNPPSPDRTIEVPAEGRWMTVDGEWFIIMRKVPDGPEIEVGRYRKEAVLSWRVQEGEA